MLFSSIPGHEHLKKQLVHSAQNGRIAHTQLFIGPEGSGTLPMALAYARYLLCNNVGFENEGGNSSCNSKVASLQHPDLHFYFPTPSGTAGSKAMSSEELYPEWRQFLYERPFGSLAEWFTHAGGDGKQGEIRATDADSIARVIGMKSYEGGKKVLIVWRAELMNNSTANKLLKILEEPSDDTFIILLVENPDELLPTVRSRCQEIEFRPFSESHVADFLNARLTLDTAKVKMLAARSQGNLSKALLLAEENDAELEFEKWFVDWVRAAFSAKGNPGAIKSLISWSEDLAGIGRERQKRFLSFCAEMFRQALLTNYGAGSLTYIVPEYGNFKLEKFAPFVHGGNIVGIFQEIEDAMYHIERNANAKIIFTDLSIKLTRYIHAK
ncbi:DNA polymerase III subunit [Flavobacterium aurantiibacter]|uniref:DNA polymerase III subunit delta n=1 Tax=Flavobacterium aurantiibacter TaxID=2023067 RepID=A0A256A2C7_9FLAO|nr:DNA polymerase III subunit [Flavobacterium aurantiibacter]OYQ47801.1 DNA polymerase III subunit delta' [Flavobacterium aurantiibacter]